MSVRERQSQYKRRPRTWRVLTDHSPLQAFNKHGDKSYILLLLFIAVATHLLWFLPGTVLFHQDWLHSTNEAASQAWQSQGTWKNFSGFGGPNIQIGYFFVSILWPIIVHIGGSFDAGVKLSVLIPTAILGFIAPYIAMRKLFVDELFIPFIAAIFYGSTTYFLLLQGAHLPIAFVYALAPLLFAFLVMALESMKVRDWVIFATTYAIGLYYEIRIMYIVTFILILYAGMFHVSSFNRTKLFKIGIIIVPVIIGLSSFWLMPTILGGASSTIAATTSQELFGNSLFDLQHALALSPSSWTGEAPDENFILQPIQPYLWIIPLVILIPLVLSRKLPFLRRKQILYFALPALLGIFLTKQVLDPLPQVYPWLYAHFPGFSLFREASKFYQLTAWGYMGLLAVGLFSLKNTHLKLFRLCAGLVVIVAGLNLLPLTTGNFGTLFVNRHIPPDYALLNKKLSAEPKTTRILWVPTDPKWAYFDTTRAKVSAFGAMQQEWGSLFKNTDNASKHQKFLAMFSKSFTHDLMNTASIKYIIVPLRDTANEDDFFKYYGDDRQFYINALDKVSWLKRVNIGTKEAVVYQNQSSQPYIGTATTLQAFPTLDNLDRLYTFSKNTQPDASGFALNDKKQVRSSTKIQDIFYNLKATDITEGSISSKTTTTNPASVYVNTNKPEISYKLTKNVLEFYASQRQSLQINQQTAGNQRFDIKKIGNTTVNLTRQYFMKTSDDLIPLDLQKEQTRNFGVLDGTPQLVSVDHTNLVMNGSLENGLWQSAVEDCNHYDEDAQLAMQLTNVEHTEGKRSLELVALNHTACSGPGAVPVKPGQQYLLNFNYRVKRANEVGYQIIFNGAAQSPTKQYLEAGGKSWQTAYRIITVPQGATKLTIKLLGLPNNGQTSTYYDNLGLTPLKTELATTFDPTPQYESIPIKSGGNLFKYTDPTYTGRNLIPDSSLENGPWQKKVGDCNAYDNKPALKMGISPEASMGKYSLELGAKSHIACTGPGAIPVKENATYLLSFDHQSPNTKAASYSVSFDDPHKGNTAIYGNVSTSERWQNFARVIKVPSGAHNLYPSIYAHSGGKNYTINRYDNFKLIEIPNIQDQFYLVEKLDKPLIAPKQIDYSSIAPTKKLIRIQKTQGPFYLTMGETYNSKWQLELNNNQVGWLPWAKPITISSKDHIKWDDFMNGWYIDPAAICETGCTRNSDGSYNLELIAEFTPQRWFYLGGVISGITSVGVGSYLVYSISTRRKHDTRTRHYSWR